MIDTDQQNNGLSLQSFFKKLFQLGQTKNQPISSHLPKTKQIGDWAENLAEQYLRGRGLRIKQRNYRCKAGEIDLVMVDKQTTVFVEVRARKQQRFGSALESVNHSKQQRLIRAAKHYLQAKKLTDKVPCRFDVISISSENATPDANIQWIPNAFTVNF